MPVVASRNQQAWVRLPPPRTKKTKPAANNTLRGPLAYFAGRSLDTKPSHKPSSRPWPVYDIDERPLRPKHDYGSNKRVVSAPQFPHTQEHYEDIVEVEEEVYVEEESEPEPEAEPEPRRDTSPPPPARRYQHTTRSRADALPPVRDRPVSTHYQTTSYQPRSYQQRSYTSSYRSTPPTTRSISLSWSNATAPLDLG